MIELGDFHTLVNYIEENTGISLPESNYQQVQSLLNQRLKDGRLTLDQYLASLECNKDEFHSLLEAVTINETYFFREEKHFRCLEEHILPALQKSHDQINFWSASCSSGEEALSLYAMGLRYLKSYPFGFQVYASDISQQVISIFKKGVYRHSSFREDGKQYKPLITSISSPVDSRHWKLKEEYINDIEIRLANLFQPAPASFPQMDVIFLRNTLIYMNLKNKMAIVDNVVNKLKIGGCLFLSAAELPHVSHPSLMVEEIGGVFFFRKRNPESLSPRLLKEKIGAAVKTIESPASVSLKPDKPVPLQPVLKSIEADVCFQVSMRLNNSVCENNCVKTMAASDFVMKILNCLQRGDSREGQQLLNECSSDEAASIPGLYAFLKGYFHYRNSNPEKAEIMFRSSLSSFDELWPARYYLVRLLPEEERLPILKRVIQDIQKYIKDQRYDYQFLLEGFNARYFLMICENMLPAARGRS